MPSLEGGKRAFRESLAHNEPQEKDPKKRRPAMIRDKQKFWPLS
jgi:hypothetical protein